MPTIEYKCGNCDHLFKTVVFRGDEETEPPCPKCKSPLTKSLPKSESLFKGISNFSTLAKDTNWARWPLRQVCCTIQFKVFFNQDPI